MQRLSDFHIISKSQKYIKLESNIFIKMFEEIMSPNFPNFMKYIKL